MVRKTPNLNYILPFTRIYSKNLNASWHEEVPRARNKLAQGLELNSLITH